MVDEAFWGFYSRGVAGHWEDSACAFEWSGRMLQSIFQAKCNGLLVGSENFKPLELRKVDCRLKHVASLQSAKSAGSVSVTTEKIHKLLKDEGEIAKLVQPQQVDDGSASKSSNATIQAPAAAPVVESAAAPVVDSAAAAGLLPLKQRWREIQGAKHWEGLLEHPIDPCLRAEIIRYGEFAQACYDAFDYNTHSKYCGSCKFKKGELLERSGLPGRGYTVTKYLYASNDPELPLPKFFRRAEVKDAWSRDADANWIGYVAVATDDKEIERLGRRDIVVAWRGTVTSLEWLENLKDVLTPAGLDQRYTRRNKKSLVHVKVESGFLHLYTSKNKTRKKSASSAREQLLWEIHRLVGKYKDEQLSITVTGHSLGGALALLSAYDIAESGMDEPLKSVVSPAYQQQGSQSGSMDPIFEYLPRPHNEDDDPTNNIPITVHSFAAPRVGNDAFRERCEELGIKVLRVVNEQDVVPKMPGLIFNEHFTFLRRCIDGLPWTYSHVGRSLQLSSHHSPYLQPTMNVALHHNLEAHLHLVDGYHGPGQPFSSATDRDPALVNKASDFLRPEHGVPPFWLQDLNKGLVRNASGKWVQPEREPDDLHHLPRYSIA